MPWDIERDEAGTTVRMWWVPGDWVKPNAPYVPKPTPCPSCGFINGWHTRKCTAVTVDDSHD